MSESQDYTLYGHFLSGPSYKAALMLALCGLPYAYRSVDLVKGAQKAPEFLALNRYGQVPVLRHAGRRLVQSNVIVEYIARQCGKFLGPDEDAAWAAKEWLAWEADRLAPGLSRVRFFTRFMPDTDPAVVQYFRTAGEAGLKVMEQSLAERPWLTGEQPSIADIGCWPAIALMGEGGMDIAGWPNVKAWAARLAALPGYAAPKDLMPKADKG